MKFIGKFTLIWGIVFIVSSILATILFFSSFNLHDIKNSDYYKRLDLEENISYLEIDEVKINFINEDVYIESISGEEFIFNLSGYYPLSESGEYPKLIVKKSGDVLDAYIDYPQKRYIFGINSVDSKLYVGVPERYYGNFNINLISGDIKVSDVVLDKFGVNIVSGDLNIQNSEFFRGDFETVSGDIEIQDFEVKGDTRISSVSGDIGLDFVDKCSIDLRFESVSGDLKNNFGKIVNGDYLVSVETISGDLKVY